MLRETSDVKDISWSFFVLALGFNTIYSLTVKV